MGVKLSVSLPEDDVAFGDDENRVSIRQKGTATGAGLGLPFAKIF